MPLAMAPLPWSLSRTRGRYRMATRAAWRPRAPLSEEPTHAARNGRTAAQGNSIAPSIARLRLDAAVGALEASNAGFPCSAAREQVGSSCDSAKTLRESAAGMMKSVRATTTDSSTGGRLLRSLTTPVKQWLLPRATDAIHNVEHAEVFLAQCDAADEAAATGAAGPRPL